MTTAEYHSSQLESEQDAQAELLKSVIADATGSSPYILLCVKVQFFKARSHLNSDLNAGRALGAVSCSSPGSASLAVHCPELWPLPLLGVSAAVGRAGGAGKQSSA